MSGTRKGAVARVTSSNGSLATRAITNRTIPMGGVNVPMIKFRTITSPKCTGSTPTALTTGRTEMTLLGLGLIFVLLLIIYRDLIKALLPVLPMLVVIGWMGGVMYIADMKYTPLTATLGALILGVGSEYAILMMERFYEKLDKV